MRATSRLHVLYHCRHRTAQYMVTILRRENELLHLVFLLRARQPENLPVGNVHIPHNDILADRPDRLSDIPYSNPYSTHTLAYTLILAAFEFALQYDGRNLPDPGGPEPYNYGLWGSVQQISALPDQPASCRPSFEENR